MFLVLEAVIAELCAPKNLYYIRADAPNEGRFDGKQTDTKIWQKQVVTDIRLRSFMMIGKAKKS